ncbi:iron ABC transporter permease [Psychromonas sp. RZ22]|uniref:FecCD family ABC transporter permease n=1 Tax=Psychromonas algarum TaxID=2555643 RepID=UPI0010673800|nr:iron ABC transporter permease [Psychromonas sp. RZ22]TEW54659.1 iron ABC transporter permease [Psychromonas sp. RZ22]
MLFTLRLFKQGLSLQFVTLAVLWCFILLAILFITLAVSATTGSYPLSLHDSVSTLLGQNQWLIDSQASLIVWEFRLPRSLVAILSGALFGLSGALLQNMTRNPLADPSLVGISQGAALAVVILTIVFPEYIDTWREIAAFSGAIFVAMIIQLLRGKGHPLKFILLGIGVAAFISAIISTLLTYGDIQSAMDALSWLAGSVHSASWHDVSILSIALFIVCCIALYQARTMSVIGLGDEVAIGLGTNLKKVMLIQLTLSVAAAAIATAVVGPIGFIGLLAPHLARNIVRSGPANHLILTALVGALLVLVADIIGKTVFAPTQLAAGLVTSLIGAPLFAYLLIKNNHK